MRQVTKCVTFAMVFLATPLLAQEEAVEQRDFRAAAHSQQLQEQIELYRQMGIDEEKATFFAMMTSGDMDASQMLMLMMMMDGGDMDDGIGIMMLMNAMKQGKKQGPPVVIDQGETLLIVEGGVLYKINPETMELAGILPYAKTGMSAGSVAKLMAPMIQGAQEQALHTSCLSNLKSLALSALMYAQDHDENLPPAAWEAEIEPYYRNAQILTCPSRPDLPIGYALNEKLIDIALEDIAQPSQIIVFFEMAVDAPNPIGGPDLVPEGGIHKGGINVAYVDGHAKWLMADEAREILGRPVN